VVLVTHSSKERLILQRKRDFLKFVIQGRSSNTSAQGFCQRLGFRECGRLTRQVRIGEQEDDEIIMEFFSRIPSQREESGPWDHWTRSSSSRTQSGNEPDFQTIRPSRSRATRAGRGPA
jgi:hypothetical protein